MSIEEKENDVIEEFEMFEDWMEKYEHLIRGEGQKVVLKYQIVPENSCF